ncbi:uncharacterized protein KGF55_000104, partial [Candida pseudojiufengensis]|uniref:uncharacterized protein n=1 Tax=Candida pseudojiufengensis TaxID=497109 RepID=UPI0022257B8E
IYDDGTGPDPFIIISDDYDDENDHPNSNDGTSEDDGIETNLYETRKYIKESKREIIRSKALEANEEMKKSPIKLSFWEKYAPPILKKSTLNKKVSFGKVKSVEYCSKKDKFVQDLNNYYFIPQVVSNKNENTIIEKNKLFRSKIFGMHKIILFESNYSDLPPKYSKFVDFPPEYSTATSEDDLVIDEDEITKYFVCDIISNKLYDECKEWNRFDKDEIIKTLNKNPQLMKLDWFKGIEGLASTNLQSPIRQSIEESGPQIRDETNKSPLDQRQGKIKKFIKKCGLFKFKLGQKKSITSEVEAIKGEKEEDSTRDLNDLYSWPDPRSRKFGNGRSLMENFKNKEENLEINSNDMKMPKTEEEEEEDDDEESEFCF